MHKAVKKFKNLLYIRISVFFQNAFRPEDKLLKSSVPSTDALEMDFMILTVYILY